MVFFQDQLHLFNQDAAFWWQNEGPFSLLHTMNPCRLNFIHKSLGSLQNLNILDVGCGGGILSEPLARSGAHVTGIDISARSIEIAHQHAQMMDLPIQYKCTDINSLDLDNFDVIIASEIIEHVPNVEDFLHQCFKRLNANGKIIISTLNRTICSYLGAIVAAEYILGWASKGTHEYQRFLKPHEIAEQARSFGYEWKSLKGMKLNPFTKEWELSQNLSINYIGLLGAQ